jgi:hypothetical protein
LAKSQKNEVSASYAPYNYTYNEVSGFYDFTTDCGITYSFGFTEDETFFDHTFDDFDTLTFQFTKASAEDAKDPLRIGATICKIINKTLQKTKNQAITYVCSASPLRPKKENEKQEDYEKIDWAALRQRVFTQWFYRYQDRFPEIKLFKTGANKKKGNPNSESLHFGLIYHEKFKHIQEAKDVIEYLIEQNVDRTKPIYSEDV